MILLVMLMNQLGYARPGANSTSGSACSALTPVAFTGLAQVPWQSEKMMVGG